MRNLLIATLTVIVHSAFAGTPTFTYVRTIDLNTHPTAREMTCAFALAPSLVAGIQQLYFGDRNNNALYLLNSPLTNSASAAIQLGVGSFSPGKSWHSIAFSGVGNDILAAGENGTTATVATASSTQSGPIYQPINMAVAGTFAGFCYPVNQSGPFLFGNTASDTLTRVSSLFTAGPVTTTAGSGTGFVPQLARASSIVYASHAANGQCGGILRFESNGAAYNASSNPMVAMSSSSYPSTDPALFHQSITYSSTPKVVINSRNQGTNGGNAWTLYDSEALGNSLTPYQVIDGTGTPDGAMGSSVKAMGACFYNNTSVSPAVTHLFLGRSDGKIQLYEIGSSSVSDWQQFD